MNVQEFQNKLKEIQEIAKQNKNTLTATDIREVFEGCDLDKNQLTGVLKYLTSQGIMIEGMEKAKEAAKGLNNANGFIKHEVNSRIKMRRIPDFHFIADDSTEYSAGIAKILNSLDIRHDDEEGTEEE